MRRGRAEPGEVDRRGAPLEKGIQTGRDIDAVSQEGAA
jgi:hypothetical protein